MSVEHIVVSEADFEYWDEDTQQFCTNCHSNFYIINALSERIFFKTKDRAAAQQAADELYGKGRYVVRTVKDMKTKSKLESGLLSCYGTATRKGQRR